MIGASDSALMLTMCTLQMFVLLLLLLRQHKVTSGQVTVVINTALETEVFCHRYLNINNSTVK